MAPTGGRGECRTRQIEDGNGRVGRMPIPLMLWSGGVHSAPHFFVADCFEANKDEYAERLRQVSAAGDRTGWTVFFLAALRSRADDNIDLVGRIEAPCDETRPNRLMPRCHALRPVLRAPCAQVPDSAAYLALSAIRAAAPGTYWGNDMVGRREILLGAGAAGVALALPAAAQAPQNWTMPVEWTPVLVRIRSELAPGEIHVDPATFSLYLIQPERKAIRYKVGIGRGDLYEPGTFYLGAKKEWPTWRPTDEMIARDPGHYARWAEGMPGGPGNPLGSRALYLFQPGRGDTFLRIHGTTEPWTIGSAVSNGCVRLVNAHVEDLYARVPLNTPIVLHPKVPAA